MKLSCVQENLAVGMKRVLPAIPSRPTLPILKNVKIETDQGMLKLTGTNLEISIVTRIGAKIEAEGAITIDAHLFSDIVSSMPEELIDLELDKTTLKLNCGNARAKLPTIEAKDYPPIPTVTGQAFEIEPDTLRNIIDKTCTAASTEDSRPVLTGINFKADGKTLACAGADGCQLAVYKVPLAQEFNALIPAISLTRLKSLLDKQAEPVKITLGETQGLFQIGRTDFQTAFIQGSFPDYPNLIPQSHTTLVTCNRADILAATRAAAIVARDNSSIVRFQINGKIIISSRSESSGNYSTNIEAMQEGEENKFAATSQYIIKALDSMNCEDIRIEINNPSSPIVFKPGDGEDHIYIVMPIFVQWESE